LSAQSSVTRFGNRAPKDSILGPLTWINASLQCAAILSCDSGEVAYLGGRDVENSDCGATALFACSNFPLASLVAREVRQPLSAILANAQAALRWLEKANVEEVREGLNGIVSDGHRASDIIKNLRAIFKNDVQEKAPVDINKLVLSVLEPVRIDLQNQKIELKTQLDDRIPEVLGNQVQLQQVILNLVMNAIESMSSLQTRVLRIKTKLGQSNTVHVSIKDTGAGIKQSDIARLFQPMFTTKTRGMGMGLSICQSIIENHDGRIWAFPGVNGGSIFHFELPTLAVRTRQAELV
jgi:signal transduction histidine kinase